MRWAAPALVAALALFVVPVAHADDPDWPALGEEAAELLGRLIRIDTTNPPGDETPAARALARKLGAEGIAAQVIESSPGRGNLHARLGGRGAGRPVVLLAHLDVVPANAAAWRLPPFGGRRENGYVYGRGALDAKGVAVVELMALVAVARSGRALDRDVILLATADEERGGRAGVGWLLERHPDLLEDAELVVNEGDHIHVRERPGERSRRIVQVAVAEKAPCWVRLTARGRAGHGATPPTETAVTRLVRALARLQAYRPPLRVTAPVAAYFAALARLEEPPLAGRLVNLRLALTDPEFLAEFTANPRQYALVRNTITPTVLAAGSTTNVIPPTAQADLDCRLLPGERPETFLDELRVTIADDAVRVEPLLSFPASASPDDSPFMTAVRTLAARHLDGAPVVPSVIAGFTDSHYFRDRGIASYGFTPFVLDAEETRRVHGVDERIAVANLAGAIERLVTLLRALPPNSR